MKKLFYFFSKAIFVLVAILCFLSFYGCRTQKAENETTKLFLAGDTSQAMIASANEWINSDPDNPIPHAILNLVYNDLRKSVLTKKELKLAYNSRESLQRVMDWSSKLAEKNTNNPHAYLLKGVSFEEYGDNETAIASYKKAIDVDPTYKQGFISLGLLYFYNNQLQEALNVYLALSERYPNYASVYCSIGLVYMKNNEMEKAIKYLKKAVELEPNNLIFLLDLSSMYIDTKATEKAIPILKKIVELDPGGDIGEECRLNLLKLQN